jgi:hypothetical protein
MNSSPLDQLADIHLPASVSWWPLAPGWWLLLSLILLAFAGHYVWRKRQARNHYRRLALRSLQALLTEFEQQNNPAQYLQKLSVLLKRSALSAQPRNFNASLKGEDWLAWLDAQCPPMKTLVAQSTPDSFSLGSGRALLIGPYQKMPQVDIAQLHALAHFWIAHHHNQWQRKKLGASSNTMAGAKHV